MATSEITHATCPRNKPPPILYYGLGFWPGEEGCRTYGSIVGPPILTDVILHNFLPLDLALIHPAPSVYNLGLFSRLPDELLYQHILEELDLLSLIKFRNTSRHAHYLVDTIPKFQILVKWAPQVVRGVLAVQTNIVATVATVVDKLRQRHCDRCGKAAQYIWLPTLDRLCFLCAHEGPMPLEEEEMLKHYGLTKNDLHLIPSFRFLPATFRRPGLIEMPERPSLGDIRSAPKDFDPRKMVPRPKPHKNSFRAPQQHILYDTQVAAQLALERTGQEILPPTATEDQEVQRIVDDCGKRQECIDLPPALVPRRCRRAMGLVFAPWVNSDGAESGVFCQECLYITGKDKNHVWPVNGIRNDCESCKKLRYQDWEDRKYSGYSLKLPRTSDVQMCRTPK